MYKMIIADDEAIIRRGIKNSLSWEELNINIVDEAEDGELALKVCKALKPDIVLVDICMPFLNGIDLIKELNKVLPRAVIVIISGHDEFKYAKEAVKLNVVDYLLKPVEEKELMDTIKKVLKELEVRKEHDNKLKIQEKIVEENLDDMQINIVKRFLKNTDEINDDELEFCQLSYLKNSLSLVMINPSTVVKVFEQNYNFENELLYFSLINIFDEIARPFNHLIIKEQEYIVCILGIDDEFVLNKAIDEFEYQVREILKRDCYIQKKIVHKPIDEMSTSYHQLVFDVEKELEFSPIVFRVKKYIEKYYYMSDLSLNQVAENVKMNPTYLSRLLKNETGNTFIDYVTKIRVEKAIELMNYQDLKMYEIAEKVGYKSQHYFSKAFKKVKGVSPKNHKKTSF